MTATALCAAAACSDPLDSRQDSRTFTLRSVGEQSLPVELVPVSEGSAVRRWWLDSGRLTLQSNGVVRFRMGLRSQLDAGPVKQSEEELVGAHGTDQTMLVLCLGSGCTPRSGNVSQAIAARDSGPELITPALFPGASSPFRFVRD